MAASSLAPRLTDILDATGRIRSEMAGVSIEVFEADWPQMMAGRARRVSHLARKLSWNDPGHLIRIWPPTRLCPRQYLRADPRQPARAASRRRMQQPDLTDLPECHLCGSGRLPHAIRRHKI
jgi:hypothetical protein